MVPTPTRNSTFKFEIDGILVNTSSSVQQTFAKAVSPNSSHTRRISPRSSSALSQPKQYVPYNASTANTVIEFSVLVVSTHFPPTLNTSDRTSPSLVKSFSFSSPSNDPLGTERRWVGFWVDLRSPGFSVAMDIDGTSVDTAIATEMGPSALAAKTRIEGCWR
ncbi:hypothetical protein BDP27DRAFT_940982 [Rhodocollybia butyracea]|uniref:Uncharacterized protein n=1 Tax=Rhodocollybia butyracea TaxID=206335 RepID=A0A9P5U5U3_9AGAR|nr:hypothetical protein BDP27DRAFT_940982 [Rhodocollybia butyracea]